MGIFFPCKANKLPHLGNNVMTEHFPAQPIQHSLHIILLILQAMNYTAHLAHQDRKISCVDHQKVNNPGNTKIFLISESASPKSTSETRHLCHTHIFCHIRITTVPNVITSHLPWTASRTAQDGRQRAADSVEGSACF